MLQRKHPDYLMKRFEELAKVLAQLLGFKETGDNHEIITVSAETLDKLFGNDVPLKTQTDFLHWLEQNGLGQHDLINLTDLLYERAEALNRENEIEKALEVYQQALTCMNYTFETEKVFPFHWASRMEYLKNKAQGLS